MAQAVFNTAQVDTRCSFKDCLMLQILSSEGSMAYKIFNQILQDWQLFQLKLRLERVAYRMGHDTISPDIFYKEYSDHLAKRFPDVGRISTIHAVIDILEDTTTLSSRIFALYDITAEIFSEKAENESSNNNTAEPTLTITEKIENSVLERFGRLTLDDKVAAGILVKTADDVEQGCFAAARMTENRYEFASSELDINTLERNDLGITRRVFLDDVG